ncbi:MAG TPA: MFS transporter [Acidimicrobiales bacterium]
MGTVRENMRAAFSSLETRNFRLFFIGQAVSITGSFMQMVAQAWLVLSITDNAAALGVVTTAQFLPTLLIGPYAGVLGDRIDKRKLLLITQAGALVPAIALGIITATGDAQLWMVLVLALCLGVCGAFDGPARQTFVLEMVGHDKLTNAVSLNNTIVNVGRLFGPMVAGLMIAGWGISACFFANAASYVVSISVLLMIRRRELRPMPRVERSKGQLREGVRAVWADPALRIPLVMMLVIGTFTYEFVVTLPVLAKDTFDVGAGGYGLMQSAMSIGAIGGGLYVASRVRPTHRWLIGSAVLLGVVMAALAVSPVYGVALLVLVPLGVGSIMFSTLVNAALQLAAAPEMRSRVMALFAVAWIGTTPIGGLLMGWITQVTNVRVALGAGALAALGTALFAWPALRDARDAGLEEPVGMLIPIDDDEILEEMVPEAQPAPRPVTQPA